jgi:hypothetical protein
MEVMLRLLLLLLLLLLMTLGWLRNEDHRPVQLVHLLPKQVHVGVQKALFALRQAALTIHLVAQPTHPVGKQRHLTNKQTSAVAELIIWCHIWKVNVVKAMMYLLEQLGALVGRGEGGGGSRCVHRPLAGGAGGRVEQLTS